MTVTEGSPDVQDASIPQEAPPAPEAPAKSPEQLAHDRLFGGTDPVPEVPAEPATPEPAAPPPEDSDTKVSRLYAQATQSEAEMRTLKQQNEEMLKKLTAFQANEDKWSADPYAALEERGVDPKEWLRRSLELDEPESPDEVAERALREVEQLKQAAEKRDEQAGQQKLQVRHAEIQGHLGKFLKDNGFEALMTSGPAVQQMSQKVFEMERSGQFKGVPAEKINGYIQELAEHYDGTLRTEVNRYVSAEGAIDRLLADEATAKILRAKLAAQPISKPNGGQVADAEGGAGNEPRTITDNLAGQAGSKSNGETRWNQNDARRRAAAAVAQAFQKQGT